MKQHTLEHALHPDASECRCNLSDIKSCVICGKDLKPSREQVDTCPGSCFRRLMDLQRGY